MAFEDLVGKTIDKVEVLDERIIFTVGHLTYATYHLADCCESVDIEKVIGDLEDIVNTPILEAEESINNTDNPPPNTESWTRTFHRLKTVKGEVTFVWLGQSNGYYNEIPYFGLTS